MRQFHIDYDDDFDVLYIKESGQLVERSQEVNDGIFASYSSSNEIIGFIVMDFAERAEVSFHLYSKRFGNVSSAVIKNRLRNGELSFDLLVADFDYGIQQEFRYDALAWETSFGIAESGLFDIAWSASHEDLGNAIETYDSAYSFNIDAQSWKMNLGVRNSDRDNEARAA